MSVTVPFKFYTNAEVSLVEVAGSFNNWTRVAMTRDSGSSGEWTISLKMKPGQHQYKYIVGQEWRHDPKYPTTDDNFGGLNNTIAVTGETDGACEEAAEEDLEDTVEFISNGDAGVHQEKRMGTYTKISQLVRGCPVYEQNIKKLDSVQYLFVAPNGSWRVGPDTTTYNGSALKNTNGYSAPPRTDWQYYHLGKWVEDNSIEAILKIKGETDGTGEEAAEEEKPREEASLGDLIGVMGSLMTAFAPKEDAEKSQDQVTQMAEMVSPFKIEPSAPEKSMNVSPKISNDTQEEEKPMEEGSLGDLIGVMGSLMTAFAPKEDAENLQEQMNQMAEMLSPFKIGPSAPEKSMDVSPKISTDTQEEEVVLLIGGFHAKDKSVEVFGQSGSLTFLTLPDIIMVSTSHYIDGQVLICGGRDSTNLNIKTCLQLIDGEFKPHSQLNQERPCLSGVILQGKLSLMGGSRSPKSMETLTGTTWIPGKEMGHFVDRSSVVALDDTRAMVIGGAKSDGDAVSIYDVDRGWNKIKNLPEPREGHSCVVLRNGDVLVAGGDDRRGEICDIAFIYNGDSWEELPGRLNTGRAWGQMVKVNGRILYFGGKNKNQYSLDTVEEFNEDTRTWTLLEQKMEARRELFSAVVVPSSIVRCRP